MSLPALPPTLAEALAAKGYDSLTPVQEAVIAADAGADLLVSAQTGSGKTVGFGLAIAPGILPGDGTFGPAAAPLALVIAPTRELAMQVRRELAWLYEPAGARLASCVGGMDIRDERRALERGAHLVVGTPGRLKDHILKGALDLSDIRAVVLDEADEMLDLGFREDLEFILGAAPDGRRTLMFSATVPKAIEKLAADFQKEAQRISVRAEGSQHADIAYQAMQVAMADADHAIVNLLRFHEAESAIIFCNTRAAVTRLTGRLANRAFPVVALSGELSQQERTHALQAMRDGRARVCVATDVAARGIDLPNLELVIHADLPTNADTLLHRSGRTGRAGRKGISALIVSKAARRKAESLLRFAKVTADWVDPPSAEAVYQRDGERLMTDPVWTEEVSDREAALAARLLNGQNARRIAAAFVRLYMKSRSAPEDLQGSAAREGQEFGPSRWFALSLGRREGAEPRWVLPMLCRTLNLGRSDVGAIRVQEEETFVEVAEAACEGLVKRLKHGAALEGGAVLRPLAKPPFAPREVKAPAPAPDRLPNGPAPKAHRKGPGKPPARPDDAAALQALLDAPDPSPEAPRKPFKPRAKDAPAGDKPKWKKPRRSGMKPQAARGAPKKR
jgi:ATP-dependent RNA helicase DeaD